MEITMFEGGKLTINGHVHSYVKLSRHVMIRTRKWKVARRGKANKKNLETEREALVVSMKQRQTEMEVQLRIGFTFHAEMQKEVVISMDFNGSIGSE